MKRYLQLSIVFGFLFGSAITSTADEKIQIKNTLGDKIEIKIYSEKELRWVAPSLKLDAEKSVEWKIEFAGDHNVKLIWRGKEFLLGTYDLQKIVKDNSVDTMEIVLAASQGKSTGKDKKVTKPGGFGVPGKPGDVIEKNGKRYKIEQRTRTVNVTKMRAETRTRTLPDGTRQTYTVQVPYTEQVMQAFQILVPTTDPVTKRDKKSKDGKIRKEA